MGNDKDFEINQEGNFLDSFTFDDEVDVVKEKLDEMNKKLPSWSLEPPQRLIK